MSSDKSNTKLKYHNTDRNNDNRNSNDNRDKQEEQRRPHVKVCRNGNTCQFRLNCTYWHSPDDIKIFVSKLNNKTKVYLFHYTFGYNPGTIAIKATHIDKAKTALYELFTTDLDKLNHIDLPGCFAQSLKDLVKAKDDFGDNMRCKGNSDWMDCTNFREFIEKAHPIEYNEDYSRIVHYSCLDG